MKHKIKDHWLAGIFITFFSLMLISIALTIFLNIFLIEAVRIVFGSFFVLFLPGFVISYIFFPKTKEFDSDEDREKGSIDWLERVALSFALSIAIVPLVVFYLNLVGVGISLLNSFLIILGIIVISLVILLVKHKRKKN